MKFSHLVHRSTKLFFVLLLICILALGSSQVVQAISGNTENISVSSYNSAQVSVGSISTLIWNTFLGGDSDYDHGSGVVVDGRGNIYVVGCSKYTWGEPVYPKSNDYDAFVAKLDSNGDLKWNTFLGGIGDDIGDAIAVDDSGNIYIAGYSEYSWDLPTQAYLDDVFVARLDSDGNLAWKTFLGGDGADRSFAISIGETGNIYLVGYSKYSWGDPIRAYTMDTDAFVAKLDTSGILQWNTFLGDDYYDVGRAIAVDRSENIYVVGRSDTAWGSSVHAFSGSTDAFVAKLDSDGNLKWNTFLGGSDGDFGNAIVIDENRNVYIAGDSYTNWGSPVRIHSGGGFYDAFAAKLDSNGVLQWNTFLGGNLADWGNTIAVDSSGNLYLAGNSDATWGSPLQIFSGATDAFTTKLNSSGVLQWNAFLGGSEYDYGNAIAMDPNGNVYLAGKSATTWGSPVRAHCDGLCFNAFVAQLGDNSIRPFLDLPVDDPLGFELAVNRRRKSSDPGLVTSWFDHDQPDHQNSTLTRWDGAVMPSSPLIFGKSSYDGHEGIDFQYRSNDYLPSGDHPVYPATDGIILYVENNSCNAGQIKCGLYDYGNQVWIDHGNGYATLYAHLKKSSILFGVGDAVTTTDRIGYMGNTGGNSPLPIHLHFSLYYDPAKKDADKTGGWAEPDEVVDPFGWDPTKCNELNCKTGPDPWGNPSVNLWKESIEVQKALDNTGGNVSSISGIYSVSVPPGALSEPLTFDLTAESPISEPSAQLRSTGYSFWLKILEWLTGGSNNFSILANEPSSSFNTPVIITVKYDPSLMSHVDTNRLQIFRWDKTLQVWTLLTTTLNTVNHQASAQTDTPGHFDLQGPPICSADSLESNDNFNSASNVHANGIPINNLFDLAQDEDWFQFDAVAGNSHTINTANLPAEVDTILEVYDADGITLLASDDNSGGGKASLLIWQAPSSGTYFVRVRQGPGSNFGCNASYELNIGKAALPLVWSDEFDDSSVNQNNWNFDVGGWGWGNQELQYYTHGNNVSIENGELVIEARKENAGYTCWYGPCQYTSARLHTQGKHEFKYGRIEASMKLPAGQGLWPAFWLLGSNFPVTPWPASGEIDIMEHKNTDNIVYGVVHWLDHTNKHAQYGTPCDGFDNPDLDVTQSHLYDIEWDANTITWHVDGTAFCRIDIQNGINGTTEFHQPFFIVLNLAVGGNWPGSPNDSTIFPARMYVDYIRVYADALPAPISPALEQPRRNANTRITPTFTWAGVLNADHYEIVIARDSSCTDVVHRHMVTTSPYTPSITLPDGSYDWQVTAYDIFDLPGRPSTCRQFTVDTASLLPPVLRLPVDNASVRSVPTFRWNSVSGAVLYQFELDNDLDFSSPLVSINQRTISRKPAGGLRGTYFWRVRAQDAAGNWSEWSEVFTVNILRSRR